MSTAVILALAGTFAVSVTATSIVKRVALRIGFVDRPGGHKGHQAPVALGGGIAIYTALFIPLLVGTVIARTIDPAQPPSWLPEVLARHLAGVSSKLPDVLGITACGTVLFVVGLIDDVRPLGPWPKFAVQFGVAIATATILGMRIAEALPLPLSILVTVLWIVLITNAFNFLDNMDGLSAGVACIAAIVLAVTSWMAGQIFVPVMACVFAGALAGFLLFNFAPASIFMGDAGSLVVGYMLSVQTVLTTFYDPNQQMRPLGLVVPIVVLAVPLYDVTSVVIHRLRAGDSPLKGDRRHFSHRLQKRGMRTRTAVLTIYLATAGTALPAIALPRADWLTAGLIIVQCTCVVLMIALLEHAGSVNGSRNADAPDAQP